jgi:hypothetical protein
MFRFKQMRLKQSNHKGHGGKPAIFKPAALSARGARRCTCLLS